ncbi:TetR family transcriptional regulator [Streptomyces abyssalis]|uniref:TetR family transcriptional regulator n=1 Tax=Streptomyces abyssalis TaxID=933944 RepID=A0A1E7JTB4_9ACTN|nr:TetR/AcrR family transcriptional regulator [Streptomyces abyssalis]OEU92145.1 TetR family transcriptional regulator [Streptomyces abyssalis]OEU94574.1 TetR family transcriptional regulator [Streptomyces abyssalis]
METEVSVETRVLDAADALFYAQGVQAVGMDRIRDASGVPLKRLYRCFPSKGALVEAYLRRRDKIARGSMEEHADSLSSPDEKILGIFEWLHTVVSEPGFRGCAFNNAFGELGSHSAAVTAIVQGHKAALRRFFSGLVHDAKAPDPEGLTTQLLVLFDGAITVAAITDTPAPALRARDAAAALLAAGGREEPAQHGSGVPVRADGSRPGG